MAYNFYSERNHKNQSKCRGVIPLVNASGTVCGHKYFYVNDQEIKGTDQNIQGNNKQWVFQYVIGA